jgi:hypothetical protein
MVVQHGEQGDMIISIVLAPLSLHCYCQTALVNCCHVRVDLRASSVSIRAQAAKDRNAVQHYAQRRAVLALQVIHTLRAAM